MKKFLIAICLLIASTLTAFASNKEGRVCLDSGCFQIPYKEGKWTYSEAVDSFEGVATYMMTYVTKELVQIEGLGTNHSFRSSILFGCSVSGNEYDFRLEFYPASTVAGRRTGAISRYRMRSKPIHGKGKEYIASEFSRIEKDLHINGTTTKEYLREGIKGNEFGNWFMTEMANAGETLLVVEFDKNIPDSQYRKAVIPHPSDKLTLYKEKCGLN